MPDAPAVDVASIVTIGNVTIRLNPAEGWERAISGNATHLVFLDGARITDPREALAAINEAALSAGNAGK